ncbi:MAG TPA: alpha/beta hydrolase [Ignavibacteriales bacterium]|nr:alpha/beta hydrolase [Ignavibacteriales bacterium]
MKNINVFLMILFLTMQISAQQKDLSGIWSGKLELPNTVKLTVVFNLAQDSAGNYSSTLDSPDQGAKGIPTESTIIKDDSITIQIPVIKGFFTGKIFYDEMKIVGKWNQGGMVLDLVVKKVDKLEEVRRPQEPKEPFPYKSEDIKFENKVDNITLAGTLTLPENGNNFPAVVMITGSGGEDRNEEVFGHKPFLVIADYLTRNGIAVLRFDDRGIGQSTGNQATGTSEDFVRDVLAGVDYLKSRTEINHSKIGLIGHSEGGMIAPMAAVKSDDVDFIILMAGTGISGDSILILQSELIQRAEGMPEEEIQKSLKEQREIYSMIVSSDDKTTLEKQLRDKFNSEYSAMSDDEKSKLGDPEVYLNMQIKTLTSPWFNYFIKYNPQPTLEKVKCPVLAINGGNDLQVPPEQNLSAIESALKKGGNKNYEIRLLPGLNHLFQTSATGAVSEYATIEETVAPIALETMADWIKKITD